MPCLRNLVRARRLPGRGFLSGGGRWSRMRCRPADPSSCTTIALAATTRQPRALPASRHFVTLLCCCGRDPAAVLATLAAWLLM